MALITLTESETADDWQLEVIADRIRGALVDTLDVEKIQVGTLMSVGELLEDIKAHIAETPKQKLYGFGARGVAVHPPDDRPTEGFAPIPLYASADEVQERIDVQNAKRGVGALSVVEYEVQP